MRKNKTLEGRLEVATEVKYQTRATKIRELFQ